MCYRQTNSFTNFLTVLQTDKQVHYQYRLSTIYKLALTPIDGSSWCGNTFTAPYYEESYPVIRIRQETADCCHKQVGQDHSPPVATVSSVLLDSSLLRIIHVKKSDRDNTCHHLTWYF